MAPAVPEVRLVNEANQIDNLILEPGNSLSTWVKHHYYLLMCGSRENPYPPQTGSLEIPQGRGGSQKPKVFEPKCESVK